MNGNRTRNLGHLRVVTAETPFGGLMLVFAIIAAAPAAFADVVVATVDGDAINASEVEQQVARVLRGREADGLARRRLQAQATEQLIGRRLILKYLANSPQPFAANEKEIDVAVSRIRTQFAATEKTLEDYLQKTNQDLPSLRRTLRWQLSWQRYVDHFLTEANLKKFFREHQREFDGSEVRVAHILWKVNVEDRAAVAQATQTAERVRKQVEADEITFASAAARHSQSPTAKQGGDVGFVTRHDTMSEPFARAAFQLDVDEISPPVVSPFGVHLIKCLEWKHGQRTFQAARIEIHDAATAYLFRWIADRQRKQAVIHYTGQSPHFRPGTRELAD